MCSTDACGPVLIEAGGRLLELDAVRDAPVGAGVAGGDVNRAEAVGPAGLDEDQMPIGVLDRHEEAHGIRMGPLAHLQPLDHVTNERHYDHPGQRRESEGHEEPPVQQHGDR